MQGTKEKSFLNNPKEKIFWTNMKTIIECSLLEEVFTTPKPGLVDAFDSGAHDDMDCQTFVLSAKAISPYLLQMMYTGYYWTGPVNQLFYAIRKIGIQAEEAMFQATNGVNTHKGIIFTMGIIGAAAGYSYMQEKHFYYDRILQVAQTMVKDAMESDFQKMNEKIPETHGEQLYRIYGERGIRGEAADGFPILAHIAFPMMEKYLSTDREYNQIKINVLFHIMTELHDTNVLSRGGRTNMRWVMNRAKEILSMGGAFTQKGMIEIKKMNEECIQKNVSPGGAADILAVTIFLRYLTSAHL